MLSLTSKLENTIITQIGEKRVDLSFNTVLKWYEIVDRTDLSLPEKIRAGWYLFIGVDTLQFLNIRDYEIASSTL